MSKPLISVITVCFNAEEFIEQCIQSVLSQDFDDFEYIIIDGGSTDGTVEIIRKYADRLAYWHSKPDRGVAHAFNLGVKHSSGQWVSFLNSDDYFAAHDVLRQITGHLKKHPDADVVFGQVVVVTREAQPKKIGGPYGGPFRWKEFSWKDSIPHPSAFSNRNYFNCVGMFNEKFHIAMDYEHYLRASSKLDAVFVPSLVTYMRFGGLSQQRPFKVLMEGYKAQQTTKAIPKWKGMSQFFLLLCRAYLLKVIKNIKG